eukprot:gb/GEZN01001235.1/.p1 GENE.gb/GEZN01001235.1/~~gb/GEZN01001235.1/.p1  ORF type:complete len:950 (-),score=130.27 gb/GEZN01001235.1/:323-3172(-)
MMMQGLRVGRTAARPMRQAGTRLSVVSLHSPAAAFSSASHTPRTDAKLRESIKTMGTHLGSVITTRDPKLFDSVERLRHMCRDWRDNQRDPKILHKIAKELEGIDSLRLKGLARAFAHFLGLSNVAENQHRLRGLTRVKGGVAESMGMERDSVWGTIKNLKEEHGLSPDAIMDILAKQVSEIVLTAHPTEVNRRTVTWKHQRIQDILTELERPEGLMFEKKQLQLALQREVVSVWASDTLKRAKPSPFEEAKAGLNVIESTLWKAVPLFLRKLDFITQELLGKSLPLHIAPIRISSWMGGDRDGNPFVTAETTMEVCLQTRWVAADLFKKNLIQLKDDLSLVTCSDEMSAVTGTQREPYRFLLKSLIKQLEATQEWADLGLQEVRGEGGGFSFVKSQSTKSTIKPLLRTNDLMYPLKLMHNSLVRTGYGPVAEGLLADTIRCLSVFGLALVPIDIRQESSRHTQALDAITKYLKLGSYASWDETKRCEWLARELETGRPLLAKGRDPTTFGFDPNVEEVLKTFSFLSLIAEDSLGGYVISHCQRASDVMAVMLLQQDAGVYPRMRVVPLFETLADLERSPETVAMLFKTQAYYNKIGGKQEIMVGYSDSGKDAGRLAAAWQLYAAQEDMAKLAADAGIELTFFHGKGGSVGRGGNPALFKAICAHPPKTINGRFRFTEQGEMITQNFGHVETAGRTLDILTAGVMAEPFVHRDPKPEWRVMMGKLSQISCEAYRKTVRHDPRFIPYFRLATPEQELANLNVGSRPAKRNPTGGLESLRAIPWVFAWTQTRLNLPAWLGVGNALHEEFQNEESAKMLIEMNKHWPWFATMLDLLEMILAKSDGQIAQHYNTKLVSDPNLSKLGKELLEQMEMTEKSVLAITGRPFLSSHDPALLRSLDVRNPYVDALNVIQVELLSRLRKHAYGPQEEAVLRDALLTTINGIAAGMRNSG